MLDVNHYGGEAVGWFALNSLEARSDGIYANLELTAKGEELVKNKAYRYLSPAFVVEYENEVRVVKEFHSVGLVNQPNLLKKSLNSKEDLEALRKENEALKKELEKTQKELEALKNDDQSVDLKEELNRQAKEFEQKITSLKVKNALQNNAMLPKREEEALKLSGESLDVFLSACEMEAKEVFKDSDLKGLQKNSISTSVEQKIAQSLGLENLD